MKRPAKTIAAPTRQISSSAQSVAPESKRSKMRQQAGFLASPLNPFIASLLGLLQVINNWLLTGDLDRKSARLNRCCSSFCSHSSKNLKRKGPIMTLEIPNERQDQHEEHLHEEKRLSTSRTAAANTTKSVVKIEATMPIATIAHCAMRSISPKRANDANRTLPIPKSKRP